MVQVKRYLFQVYAVLIATLGMLADGMQFGWSSNAMIRMQKNTSHIILTKNQAGNVTMCYILGTFPGVVCCILIFSRTSRKLSVIIACIPICLAWIFIILAKSVTMLYIGRLLGGMGKNMVYVSVPMYIGEIAEPQIRGMLGNIMYTMMNMGVFMSYAIVPFTDYHIAPLVGMAIVGTQMILFLLMPGSPYHLIEKNKMEEAEKVLKFLRNRDDVQDELKAIEATVRKQTQNKVGYKSQFKLLFTHEVHRKALIIVMVMRGTQILSGVAVITMHVHQIIKQVTSKSLSTEISAMCYSAMMISSTFVSMVITDMFGRRSLMFVSCFCSALSFGSLAFFFFVDKYTSNATAKLGFIPLISLATYVYGYRIGLGTVPLVLTSELFSASVKVVGVALGDLSLSLNNFAANRIYFYFEKYVGLWAAFATFMVICILVGIYSYFYLPETKGKTLDEIQTILQGNELTPAKVEDEAPAK